MVTQNQFSRLQARILRQLSLSEPTGATLRDLRRNMSDKTPDEISEILRQLVETGEVIEAETQPGASGGRKTTRFRIAQ